MWEIVTLGSTPYPGMSGSEVMKKVREGQRLDKPEHCDREIYNMMFYCWDKDPSERPTFKDLVQVSQAVVSSVRKCNFSFTESGVPPDCWDGLH